MSNRFTFDDGSALEALDDLLIEYTEGAFSTVFALEVEPGFFQENRVFRPSMLERWTKVPDGFGNTMDSTKRREIVSKLRYFFLVNGDNCRIDP